MSKRDGSLAASDWLAATRVAAPGLHRRVRILHLTDIHICRPDKGDPREGPQTRRQEDLRKWEAALEGRARRLVEGMMREKFDAVVVTGDLVDFNSRAGIRAAGRLLKACRSPVLFVGGNHDSMFPTETGWDPAEMAWESERWDILGRLRPRAAARWEVKGLQILGIDDARYQISAEQAAFVKKHLATGQPTVIALHIPLTSPRLRKLTVVRWKYPILLGEKFTEPERGKWLADPEARATGEFLRMVRKARNVRAVLSGHVHFGFEEPLSGTAVQLVGPPAFEGAYRVVEFAGE